MHNTLLKLGLLLSISCQLGLADSKTISIESTNLTLVALIQGEDGSITASIIDRQRSKSIHLKVGDVKEGIHLLQADTENETATILMGTNTFTLRLPSSKYPL